jgi:hypothetical protein
LKRKWSCLRSTQSTVIKIDHSTTTFLKYTTTVLSTGTIHLLCEAWPCLAIGKLSDFSSLCCSEILLPCARVSQTHPVLHDTIPQLTLWYNSSHWHGSQFLCELKRSTEMSKNAYFSLRLRKPQVWNFTSRIDIIKLMPVV